MTKKSSTEPLVTRVKNKHSGKVYLITTSQGIGGGFWGCTVAKINFFGLFMDWKNKLAWIRNTKEDAYKIHSELKEVVANIPESEWQARTPDPSPPVQI